MAMIRGWKTKKGNTESFKHQGLREEGQRLVGNTSVIMKLVWKINIKGAGREGVQCTRILGVESKFKNMFTILAD